MKVDVTAIFFNSVIPDATATAPWCVSIGQGKDKKIKSDIPGLQEILDGLIYKAVPNKDWVDLSKGSRNNEYLLISKFDKIFVNGNRIPNIQIIATLVREHTKSHEGRLRISIPPYAKFDDGDNEFSNEQTYQSISDFLGCGNINGGGCWFVDDISVFNQDELHFTCIVVNQEHPVSYNSSQTRSSEWQSVAPESPIMRVGVHESTIITNNEQLQLIYYGAPGTGKSFTIDQATNENNSVRTTFHPDSDYAGFVGAYKPTMESVPLSAFVGKEVHVAQPQGEHTGKERKIVYKYVPQAFLKAYVEAWKRYAAGEDNPYYLVIEEINRGNCAQIFGDLFQLLDRNNTGSSSYAISADEDIAQFLRDDEKGFASLSDDQKSAISGFKLKKDSGSVELIGPSILDGTKLLLPPNLRIWATMNTSDQSLFPIDSAFKRRWNWEYVAINTNPTDSETKEPLNWKLKIGDKIYTWGSFLDKINPLIDEITQSEDKQMGYFFAKPDKDGDTITTKVFVNKVLFYLWTDVFKDYDLTDKRFTHEVPNEKGEKVNKAYKFRDFFPIENNKLLVEFVNGLGLTEVGNMSDTADVDFDAEGDADLNDNKNDRPRDYSKYSVNGIGNYTKSDAVVEAIKALVASIPNPNTNIVLDKVKDLKLSYTLVYSEPDYNSYLEKSTDDRFAKRYAKLELGNGESLYVYRGSTPERIAELIKGLENTNSGVVLSKVE